MLGRLYRFITEQSLDPEGFSFEPPAPDRILSGDIRSLHALTQGHRARHPRPRLRGAARHRRILVVEAHAAPTRIRRRIAAMSVADEFYVHIFPEDFPVNIANPGNLRELREAFPGRQVSIVVGSDVVAHASSYRKPVEPDSIHTFDHVILPPRRAGRYSPGLQLHPRACRGADAAAGA